MDIVLATATRHIVAAPVEALGYVAAFFTTAAYVPQLLRVVHLRSARDVSLPTFLMFAVGVFLWMLYGLYTGSRPIVACNAATLVLALCIVVLKLRYDRPRLEKPVP